jgi:hypothetical protein
MSVSPPLDIQRAQHLQPVGLVDATFGDYFSERTPVGRLILGQ